MTVGGNVQRYLDVVKSVIEAVGSYEFLCEAQRVGATQGVLG